MRHLIIGLLLVCRMALAQPDFISDSNTHNAPPDNPFPHVAAAYLVQIDGKPLWEKSATQRLPPASLTKLLTALLIVESVPKNNIVTISRNAAQESGTRLGVRAGERFHVEDLLGAMLLDSANDACHALAEKATLEIADLSGAHRFKLQNKNVLIGRYPGTLGLKTGFTPQAGKCLIAYVRHEPVQILLVLLNAPNRRWDASDITRTLNLLSPSHGGAGAHSLQLQHAPSSPSTPTPCCGVSFSSTITTSSSITHVSIHGKHGATISATASGHC